MAKDRYEISLWEDYSVPEDSQHGIPSHYEERKIAVIGSDSMTAPCRALEPRLVENINGTATLTFKMLYLYNISDIEDARARGIISNDLTWYVDDEDETKYRNPFQNLLVNERKVKAFWKNKWYDFVIKNIQEDSNGRSCTYTCTDLFINELSKNGFSIELDDELENNQGTAEELATKVLNGTDWKFVGANGRVLVIDGDGNVVESEEEASWLASDIIQQDKEEPVYEVTLTTSLTNVTNQTTGETGITIQSGKKILVYYQQIENFRNDNVQPTEFQFAYTSSFYETDTNSQLVINADCYTANIQIAKDGNNIVLKSGNVQIHSGYLAEISMNYRASRLVRNQVCKFDPLTEKYCYIYKAIKSDSSYNITENDEIYMYRETKYEDATFVNSLIVNGKDITPDVSGWSTTSTDPDKVPVITYEAAANEGTADWFPRTGIKLGAATYINSGLKENRNFIPDGLIKGQQFIIRYKEYTANSRNKWTQVTNPSNTNISFRIKDKSGNYYATFSAETYVNGYLQTTVNCSRSATTTDLFNKNINLLLVVSGNCILGEIEFFPYVLGLNSEGKEVMICPGEYDKRSLAQVYYTYYNHTKSDGLLSKDQVDILYSGTSESEALVTGDSPVLDPILNEDFEKIRSISAKHSNRFNILQTIAETFECWMRFNISHDYETGKTVYVNGIPQKFVSIKREIGNDTGVSFVYGIDLQTISRTIKSDQIVTKTIVEQNSNEFAQNGFCTIARSEQNPSGTNDIYNFDYYINNGLIDRTINADLYNGIGDDNVVDKIDSAEGYFPSLRKLSKDYDGIIETLTRRRTELAKQSSYLTLYTEAKDAAVQEEVALTNEAIAFAGVAKWSDLTGYMKNNPSDTKVKTLMATRNAVTSQIKTFDNLVKSLTSSIDALEKVIKEQESAQKKYLDYIKRKNTAFYKKYSRFIQEGSWISEEYIDDDLYYLDAQSVAYTSSRPQIEYNISVLRISSIEGFESKIFHLGDIGYIQDKEFFGYTQINGVKTPIKEQVLVSEVVSNFEEPEKDSFKVQNYKTQFEDLFQRITATTQSLQYSTGQYAKAANVVDETGNIKAQTLQSSIALNEQLVISAKNENVYWDSTGLTVANTLNPNNKIKVTSSGVLITTDGGATWKNAITNGHISTSLLAAGMINANEINIMNGDRTAFRWNSQGINAFGQYRIDDENTSINTSKFVRFDHYGIYGMNGLTDFNPDVVMDGKVGETLIWDKANFGMTWHGFFLHNNDGTGSVEISTDEDIRVLANDTERIKIGRLYKQGEKVYTEVNDYFVADVSEGFDPNTVYYIKENDAYVVFPTEGVVPDPDTTYYVEFKDNEIYYLKTGEWYDPVSLAKFKDGVDYYIIYPQLLDLFVRQDLFIRATLPGSSFDPNETYYEKDGDEYFISPDSEPDATKQYYVLGDFDPNIQYYVKNSGIYMPIATSGFANWVEATYTSGGEYWYWNTEINDFSIEDSPDAPIDGRVYYIRNLERYKPSDKWVYYSFDDKHNQSVTYYTRDSSGDFTPVTPPFLPEVTYYDLIATAVTTKYEGGFVRPAEMTSYYIKDGEVYSLTSSEDFDRGFSDYGYVGNGTYEELTYYYKKPATSYGIRISNGSGAVVMETSDSGELWLRNRLNIGADVEQSEGIGVAIGFLDADQYYTPADVSLGFEEGTTYYELVSEDTYEPTTDLTPQQGKTYYLLVTGSHKVFHSRGEEGEFIVYEDGTINATNGRFRGYIEATDGVFSGSVNATTGNIGPITITEEGLVAREGKITIYNDGLEILGDLAGIGGVQGFSFNYEPVEITEFAPDVNYFYKNNEEQFVYVTPGSTFDPDKQYYIINTDYYTDLDKTQKVDFTQTPNPVDDQIYYYGNADQKLYFDSSIGELVVKGNIYAENGYFKGELRSTTGLIGGFNIGADELTSVATDSQGHPLIILNGTEGSISANNLTLGSGANIADYLQLGDHVRLQNANVHDGKYLVVTDENDEYEKIIFTNDSRIYLGGTNENDCIILDGDLSSIYGGDSSSQRYFNITPDLATFRNVNVSGKISTVVFEQAHVQAVGGAMVFKPSFKIESIDSTEAVSIPYYRPYNPQPSGAFDPTKEYYKFNSGIPELVDINEEGVPNPDVTYCEKSSANGYKVTLEDVVNTYIDNFENTYIDLVSNDGVKASDIKIRVYEDFTNEKVCYLSKEDIDRINLNENILDLEIQKLLIILGKDKDITIGINSNEAESDYLRAKGLTITELDFSETNPTYKVKTFLGDLDAAKVLADVNTDAGRWGYGLYTENAYLNGSLTTRVRRRDEHISSYAGVNTLNGVPANVFGEKGLVEDDSAIIFWAGAQGLTNEDIQQSPFQVTENGSLYSYQGLFEGAIISRSEVRGVDIYAARIHGTGKEEPNKSNNYGLAFYNMANGIVFKTGLDNDEEYQLYDPQPSVFEEGKEYWYLNESDIWIKETSTSPISTRTYYEHLVANTVFWIGQNGLSTVYDQNSVKDQDYFIRINNGNIYFTGKEFNTMPFGGADSKRLIITNGEIGFYKATESESLQLISKVNFAPPDTENLLRFSYYDGIQENSFVDMDFKNGRFDSFAGTTGIANILTLKNTVEYKPAMVEKDGAEYCVGYNLYVKNNIPQSS